MARAAKPAHVVARQQATQPVAEQDFSWLDDDRPMSGYRKRKNREKKAALERKRQGIGSPQQKHRRTMTEDRWKKALELTANGVSRPDMLKIVNITKETFDAYLITSLKASKQLQEAGAVWLRRDFSFDEIESALTKMSLGRTLSKMAEEMGWDEARKERFVRLMRRDTRLCAMYDQARELQSEGWMDENIDIADGVVTFIDAKGVERIDNASVQDKRLRIDTRQWTMGNMNRKRFGEHKHIDHGGEIQVNHAAQLSNARKRLEGIKPAVIDNESQQVVNQ